MQVVGLGSSVIVLVFFHQVDEVLLQQREAGEGLHCFATYTTGQSR